MLRSWDARRKSPFDLLQRPCGALTMGSRLPAINRLLAVKGHCGIAWHAPHWSSSSPANLTTSNWLGHQGVVG